MKTWIGSLLLMQIIIVIDNIMLAFFTWWIMFHDSYMVKNVFGLKNMKLDSMIVY